MINNKQKSDDIKSVISTWITPGLVSIIGLLLWSTLSELRHDVRVLINDRSGINAEIVNLKQAVEELKRKKVSYDIPFFLKEKPPFKKEDEIVLPKRKKA